jgi:hypothetical protein
MSAVMDDFATLHLHGAGRSRRSRYDGDKGQAAQMRAFADMVEHGATPTPFPELVETTRLTWLALEAARARETRMLA